MSFNHREWQIDAQIDNSVLSITFKNEELINGRLTLEKSEINAFTDLLSSFYIEGKRGTEFNDNNPTQTRDLLTTLRASRTNWGEPFSQGIRFVFSEDFEKYMLDNLYFELEETDAKELLERLLKNNE